MQISETLRPAAFGISRTHLSPLDNEPSLISSMLRARGKAKAKTRDKDRMSWAEFFVSFTTIPIPLMLNLFWFYKIVKKASRMIFGKSKPKDL